MGKSSPENKDEKFFSALGSTGESGSLFAKSAAPAPDAVAPASDEAVRTLRKNMEDFEKKLSDAVKTLEEANRTRLAASEEAERRVSGIERRLSEFETRLSGKADAQGNLSGEWVERVFERLRIDQNRLENFEKRLSDAASNSAERVRLAIKEMELRVKSFEQKWTDALAKHSGAEMETVDTLRESLAGLEKRLLRLECGEDKRTPGPEGGDDSGRDIKTMMLDMESKWSALGLILSRLDRMEKDIRERLENRIKRLEKVLTEGEDEQFPLVSLPRQISAIRTWISDIRRELGISRTRD